MADFNYRAYPHIGIAVPTECPFWPIVDNDGNDTYTVRFNQGYVFDYQVNDPTDGGTIKKIKVTSDPTYSIGVDPKKFFLKIITDANSAKVKSAEIIQDQGSDGVNFHYNMENAATTQGEYSGSNQFTIPLCVFEKGKLKEIFLRENIHWQKINFENKDESGFIGVVHDWGQDASTFGDSPRVIFKAIGTPSGNYFIEVNESTGGNIEIKSKIPDPEDPSVLLYEGGEFKWLKYDPTKDQILVQENGLAKWLESGSDNEVFSYTSEGGFYWKTDNEGTGTGGGMPEGNIGEILYNDGTDADDFNGWRVLAPVTPSDSEIAVLQTDGTTPSWKILVKHTITTCDGDIEVYGEVTA